MRGLHAAHRTFLEKYLIQRVDREDDVHAKAKRGLPAWRVRSLRPYRCALTPHRRRSPHALHAAQKAKIMGEGPLAACTLAIRTGGRGVQGASQGG